MGMCLVQEIIVKYKLHAFGGTDIDSTLSIMMSVLALTTAFGREDENSAAVFYPGIFDTNIGRTLEQFRRLVGHQHSSILIAGHHEEALQPEQVSEEVLRSVFPQAVVKSQILAANTPGQAIWVSEQIADLTDRVVYLYAPAFHLPRAYLTQLKVLLRMSLGKVLLLPRILPGDPLVARPLTAPWAEDAVSQQTLVSDEAWKIRSYTAMGDVASQAELDTYLGTHSRRLHW
jgi:hypothetical protein